MKLNKKYLLFLILATGLINQTNAWYDCRGLWNDCSSYVPSIPSLFYVFPDKEQISELISNNANHLIIPTTITLCLGLVYCWHKVKAKQKYAKQEEESTRERAELEKEMQLFNPRIQKLIKNGRTGEAAKIITLNGLKNLDTGSDDNFLDELLTEKLLITNRIKNHRQILDQKIEYFNNQASYVQMFGPYLNLAAAIEPNMRKDEGYFGFTEKIRNNVFNYFQLLRNFFPRLPMSRSNN